VQDVQAWRDRAVPEFPGDAVGVHVLPSATPLTEVAIASTRLPPRPEPAGSQLRGVSWYRSVLVDPRPEALCYRHVGRVLPISGSTIGRPATGTRRASTSFPVASYRAIRTPPLEPLLISLPGSRRTGRAVGSGRLGPKSRSARLRRTQHGSAVPPALQCGAQFARVHRATRRVPRDHSERLGVHSERLGDFSEIARREVAKPKTRLQCIMCRSDRAWRALRPGSDRADGHHLSEHRRHFYSARRA